MIPTHLDGSAVEVRRSIGGGSINEAARVELADGRTLFLKYHRQAPPGMFAAEASGLEALGRAIGGPRIPAVIEVAESYLALEWVPPGRERDDQRLGQQLARLHRTIPQDLGLDGKFGFRADNFCGLTPQINTWTSNWIEFFAQHRIGYQLDRARKRGLLDNKIEQLAPAVLENLGDHLIEGVPSLIHGDLWGGNAYGTVAGEPVIFDPATSFSHREADLAMTELFGGYSAAFYEGYNDEWPLEPGYDQRRDLYNLYHLLNHLNLFGRSYASQVISVMKRYA